ncbi:hypothetical protein D922_01811 [Enterococcus faecalis 06-MB-DW-09]|nr:hypothetical protein D922_01811 [Enterococcus faecalis 06-MB-DW-09]
MNQENQTGRLWLFVLAFAIVILITPIVMSNREVIQDRWQQWFSNRQIKM